MATQSTELHRGVPPCPGLVSLQRIFWVAVTTLQRLFYPARACLLWLRQSSLPLEFSIGRPMGRGGLATSAAGGSIGGMTKMIIGGFLPLKILPCHWFMEMAWCHWRPLQSGRAAHDFASAVFILKALATTLGCLLLLLPLDQDPQLANP